MVFLLAGGAAYADSEGAATDAGAPAAATDKPTLLQNVGAALGISKTSSADYRRVIAKLDERAARLSELGQDQLAVEVNFEQLLGVDPDDSLQIEIARRKWRSMLRSAQEVDPPGPDAGTDADAGTALDGGTPGAASTSEATAEAQVWGAELKLAQLRSDFFSLTRERRETLIAKARQRAEERVSQAAATARKLDEAEEAEASAAKQRQEELAAAEAATSELQKLLHEQLARLLAIKAKQAAFNADLLRREQVVAQATESALGWRRRVSELVDQGMSAPADGLYEELRGQLRDSRKALANQLRNVVGQSVAIPAPSVDEVITRGVEVDRRDYDKLRTELLTQSLVLTEKHRTVVMHETENLVSQAESLNRDRLRLLRYVTPALRDRLTGFSRLGLDQAKAEAEQVRLLTRYHVVKTVDWVDSFSRRRQSAFEDLWGRVAWFKLLLAVAVFWYWRRKGAQILDGLALDARKKRVRSLTDDATIIFTRVYRRIRGPVEWLILAWVIRALLHPDLAESLEVRLLWLVISWTLGGATLVLLIDSLAGRQRSRVKSAADVPALRLQSLTLIGRAVVAFGLVLALSVEFVGEGTLHSWVISSCWLAAIPITLLLISRWKPTVYERLGPRKNKNRVVDWVLRHERGPLSHFAASVGSAYLMSLSVIRWVREHLIELELVKYVLAYLFQRSMSEQAETTRTLHPLIEPIKDQLTSANPADEFLVSIPDHKAFFSSIRDAAEAKGGVFALVGELGSGKSTFLRMLQTTVHASCFEVQCPAGTPLDFQRELLRTLGLNKDADPDEFQSELTKFSQHARLNTIVLVDDAHRLMSPTIGGLRELKHILDVARQAGEATWLLTFDSALFSLFEQAHGIRPIFDEVFRLKQWTEQCVGALVDGRNRAADIDPSMRLLLPDIRRGDEIDHAERLARTREGFYRMLWNFSDGNPAVALHFWTESLGNDGNGQLCVRPLTTPKTNDLETLPDKSAFVLRALVRLEIATPQQIAQAANVDFSHVRSILRYAVNKGYVEVNEQSQMKISQHWYRSIKRVLQRKHFLPST